jgi:hypothetical protein
MLAKGDDRVSGGRRSCGGRLHEEERITERLREPPPIPPFVDQCPGLSNCRISALQGQQYL